jgi:hypothetical protein
MVTLHNTSGHSKDGSIASILDFIKKKKNFLTCSNEKSMSAIYLEENLQHTKT